MKLKERLSLKVLLKLQSHILIKQQLREKGHNLRRIATSRPFFAKIRTVMRIYLPDRHRRDIRNFYDKIFIDELVKLHLIADDNFNVILSSTQEFAGIDKNARIEFELIEVENREN